MPDEIAKLQTQYAELDEKILEKQEALADREHEIFKGVCAEVDSTTGKAKFSNETLRQGETDVRKKGDEAYVTIAKELKTLRDQRSTLKISLDLTTNKFSAVKHKSDLYAAWMRQSA